MAHGRRNRSARADKCRGRRTRAGRFPSIGKPCSERFGAGMRPAAGRLPRSATPPVRCATSRWRVPRHRRLARARPPLRSSLGLRARAAPALLPRRRSLLERRGPAHGPPPVASGLYVETERADKVANRPLARAIYARGPWVEGVALRAAEDVPLRRGPRGRARLRQVRRRLHRRPRARSSAGSKDSGHPGAAAAKAGGFHNSMEDCLLAGRAAGQWGARGLAGREPR